MYADLRLRADLFAEVLGKKVDRLSQRRALAEKAVARQGVSTALACWAFGMSETYYRYGLKLMAADEEIADLLFVLTNARKAWGFGLSFCMYAK